MSNKYNGDDSVDTNQMMSKRFKGCDPDNIITANSDIERTNQQIQKEFYENEKENYSLPFHVDINNPPIKK